jgi:hypothetical protein
MGGGGGIDYGGREENRAGSRKTERLRGWEGKGKRVRRGRKRGAGGKQGGAVGERET